MEYTNLSYCFKALGDETRTKIFDILKNGKMCACKILEEFNFTQPTLSYHMKMLVDSGLVLSEKKGIWNYYTVNYEMLEDINRFLSKERLQGNMCFNCNKIV